MQNNQNHSASQVEAKPREQASRKAAPFLFLLCLVVAVAAVLFVPMFAGGAVSASSSIVQATPVLLQQEDAFEDLDAAAKALGFAPKVPQQLPAGYTLTAIRALSGGVLEMEYASGKEAVLFRTAPGADDLSDDATEYTFTATEEAGTVARSYAGQSQQKLSLAVWAADEASFSIQAASGIPAAEMRAMAESVG